jgi:hypothetical protein
VLSHVPLVKPMLQLLLAMDSIRISLHVQALSSLCVEARRWGRESLLT